MRRKNDEQNNSKNRCGGCHNHGLSMNPTSKADKWLKCLMMVHGVFFISCFIMPMTGVFTDMASGGTGSGGTIALLGWCAYFIRKRQIIRRYL